MLKRHAGMACCRLSVYALGWGILQSIRKIQAKIVYRKHHASKFLMWNHDKYFQLKLVIKNHVDQHVPENAFWRNSPLSPARKHMLCSFYFPLLLCYLGNSKNDICTLKKVSGLPLCGRQLENCLLKKTACFLPKKTVLGLVHTVSWTRVSFYT